MTEFTGSPLYVLIDWFCTWYHWWLVYMIFCGQIYQIGWRYAD